MVMTHDQVHIEVMHSLTALNTLTSPADFAAARTWYKRYIMQVAVPTTGYSRTDLLIMYGRLLRAAETLATHVCPGDRSHHCEARGCLSAYATISSALFVVWMLIFRHTRQVKEIAPFFPISWQAALYNGFDVHTAAMTYMAKVLEVCWDEADTEYGGGVQYIGVCIGASPGDWYPGVAARFIQRGPQRGQPRYPKRVAEHGTAIANPLSRDGHLWRYGLYRAKGLSKYIMTPALIDGDLRVCYNREQVLIRARRPRTTGTGQHFHRVPKPRNTPRRRPPQSVRRRELRKKSSGGLAPQLGQNFNVAKYAEKWHVPFGQTRPSERTVNYTTVYRSRVQNLSAETRTVCGPISLTAKGEERLFAEFLATPGRRADAHADQMTNRQLFTVAAYADRVRGLYRARLFKKRLWSLMMTRGLPKPKIVRIGIRRSVAWLQAVIAMVVRLTIADVATTEPALAIYMKAQTRVMNVGDPKVAAKYVNEHEASRRFDYRYLSSLSKEARDAWADSREGMIARRNWDIPQRPRRDDVYSEISTSLRGWLYYFQVHPEETTVRKLLSEQWEHFTPIPEDPEDPVPSFTEDVDEDEVAVCRMDKDEHVLSCIYLMQYHCLCYRYFVEAEQTFRITGWSLNKAAAYCHLMYLCYYPLRFRRDVRFTKDSLPRAIVRGKAKCHGDEGLHCQKPGHVHHRLVVSTAALPCHWQDRIFHRAWQIGKMADPMYDAELWSLRDASKKHRASRGTLVHVPAYKHVCAGCGGEKSEVSLCRVDVGAFYTAANMKEVEDLEGPQLLHRLFVLYNSDRITIELGRKVRGQVRGHPQQSFFRQCVTHNEMMQHLVYENRIAIFALGKGRRAVVFEQVHGCGMGARLSKMKCSLLLGGREGRAWADVRRQAAMKMHVEGLRLEQILSLIRLVDDGSLAATCHCVPCVRKWMQEVWGLEMDVTLEESGESIRFTDFVETFRDGRFFLRPFHMKSHLEEQPYPVNRYIPHKHHPQPIRYVRSLIIAKLHRWHQIIGDNLTELQTGLLELCVELHAPPLKYQWNSLALATRGIHLPWAMTPLFNVRATLHTFSDFDKEGKQERLFLKEVLC
jgi:hypothetical protein